MWSLKPGPSYSLLLDGGWNVEKIGCNCWVCACSQGVNSWLLHPRGLRFFQCPDTVLRRDLILSLAEGLARYVYKSTATLAAWKETFPKGE